MYPLALLSLISCTEGLVLCFFVRTWLRKRHFGGVRDVLKTMREDQKFLLGLLGKTESSNCEPATEQVSVYGILERLRKRKGPSKGPFIINRSCLDCFT